MGPTKALAYFEAAPASYPFGPEEGCYAVEVPASSGCENGSGCSSSAGSLCCIAEVAGIEVVAERVASDLVAWLRDDAEPVALHARSG